MTAGMEQFVSAKGLLYQWAWLHHNEYDTGSK